MKVGSVPVGRERRGRVTLMVIGMYEECWRCDRVTCRIVGFTRPGRLAASEVVRTESDALMGWAARLVPEEVRRRAMVGEIKVRYSRVEGRSYVCNGCPYCDALQDPAGLLECFLAQAAAGGGTVEAMPVVHQLEMPVRWWKRLVRDHPMEPITAASYRAWPQAGPVGGPYSGSADALPRLAPKDLRARPIGRPRRSRARWP